MTGGSGFFDYGLDGTDPVDDGPDLFLEAASDADWSMLLAYGERRVVGAGDVVVEMGETSRDLIIVLSGSFSVTVPTGRRGRSKTIGRIDAGSVFGELAFFDGAPRSSSVVADEDGEIFVLGWTAFERLAAVRPALATLILADLGTILASRFRRVSRQAFGA